MAGEQKLFIKRIGASWRREFPFLKPVDLDEVPRLAKGCNFICDDYGKTKGRYYFVHVDFSPKRRGEFSIGVVVSPSPGRSMLDPAMVDHPTCTSIGSFAIWKFMRRSHFVWALVDLDAESIALLGFSSGLPKSPNVWRPTTYDQPIEKICDEAIAHVNQTLRTQVFPVLQIDA